MTAIQRIRRGGHNPALFFRMNARRLENAAVFAQKWRRSARLSVGNDVNGVSRNGANMLRDETMSAAVDSSLGGPLL
jgi:hypothetical protein